MLHLTGDKVEGGAPGTDKRKSWADILALFPGGAVFVQPWEVRGLSNQDWERHLRSYSFPAECYYYADTYGMYPAEDRFPLDISQHLKQSPQIPARDCSADLEIPRRPYVTMQWHSGGNPNDIRRVSESERARIIDKYVAAGFEIVFVGGESENPLLRSSLKHVGYAMAHAALHVGIDSGPMHLASCYLPYNRLHLYTARAMSHHARRWLMNGAVMDHYDLAMSL